MEQRGVIVTAIILALILAGGLWFTLTRTNPTPTPEATITPTDAAPITALEETPLPSPFGDIAPASTVAPEAAPVQPTARSGAGSTLALVTATLVSGFFLKYAITTPTSSRE